MSGQRMRLKPTPDNIAGENLPYRGAVDHGVPYTGVDPIAEDQYWDEGETEYEPEEEAQAPIPVRVVNQGAREVRRFSTRQYKGDGTNAIIQIADRNERRTSLTIIPDESEGVFIGHANVSRYSGFPVGGSGVHGTVTLRTTEPVYATSGGFYGVSANAFFVVEEWTEAVE